MSEAEIIAPPAGDRARPPAGPPQRPLRDGQRHRRRIGYRLSHNKVFYRLVAALAWVFARVIKWLGPERGERFALAVVHTFGPLMAMHRTAVANVAAAFPQKSAPERWAIVRGCWENLARSAVEFIFIDRIAAAFDPARPDVSSITIDGIEHVEALRKSGRPAIIFSAHLANWEVAALVLAALRLPTVVPFKTLRNPYISRYIRARRAALIDTMVDNSRGAALKIAAAFERGNHLVFLTDQRLSQGLSVPFFGRPALTNPIVALFTRRFDCPVYGARVIRCPDRRLRVEIMPVTLPRDGEGRIDVAASTARVNQIVETWVREHPDQWLWLHNRWKS